MEHSKQKIKDFVTGSWVAHLFGYSTAFFLGLKLEVIMAVVAQSKEAQVLLLIFVISLLGSTIAHWSMKLLKIL